MSLRRPSPRSTVSTVNDWIASGTEGDGATAGVGGNVLDGDKGRNVLDGIGNGVDVKGESGVGVLIAIEVGVGIVVSIGFAVAVGDGVEIQAPTNRSKMIKTALSLPIFPFHLSGFLPPN